MSFQIIIEKASLKHIDAIAEIERSSFVAPWSRKMLLSELEGHDFSHAHIAKIQEDPTKRPVIAGYIFFWSVADEIHIINIAVHPRFRKMGIGRRLLQVALDYGRKTGARHAFLEVRVSNLNAQHLYTKMGFKVTGMRRGYYTDNREDALVMKYVFENDKNQKPEFRGQNLEDSKF
jgi:ribosomal-protein-alanine N-acetyltransferase